MSRKSVTFRRLRPDEVTLIQAMLVVAKQASDAKALESSTSFEAQTVEGEASVTVILGPFESLPQPESE